MASAVQRRGTTRSDRSRGTRPAFFSIEEAAEAGGASGAVLGDGEGSGHGIDDGHGDDSIGHVQNGTRERGEGRMEARVCRGVNDNDFIGGGRGRMAATHGHCRRMAATAPLPPVARGVFFELL